MCRYRARCCLRVTSPPSRRHGQRAIALGSVRLRMHGRRTTVSNRRREDVHVLWENLDTQQARLADRLKISKKVEKANEGLSVPDHTRTVLCSRTPPPFTRPRRPSRSLHSSLHRCSRRTTTNDDCFRILQRGVCICSKSRSQDAIRHDTRGIERVKRSIPRHRTNSPCPFRINVSLWTQTPICPLVASLL